MKLIIESNRLPENFTGIVEYNGAKFWYRNGELHRESGPACEYADGDKYWYFNGIAYTESAYKAEIAKRSTTPPCNGKIVEIDGKKYQLTAI